MFQSCHPLKISTGAQPNSDKGAKSYKLPDGTDLIFSNKELSSVPEMLFTSPGFGEDFHAWSLLAS